MDATNIRIETADLLLREFRPDDCAAVQRYAGDPVVVEHLEWGPNTADETRAFVQKVIGQQHAVPRLNFELAVTLRATGELIGAVALLVRDEAARAAELGYGLQREYWRRGYGTQAAKAVVEFGFRRLALHRIWATCRSANVGSARVLERCGLRFEGRLRQNKLIRGSYRDSYLFAVLASDRREEG